MWLSEGLAEFFAPTTTDRTAEVERRRTGNDLRMFELEQYLKSRAAEDAGGQLVAQTVGAARLTSTGYAAAWGLTQYLAKYQPGRLPCVRPRSQPAGAAGGARRGRPSGRRPGKPPRVQADFGDDLADLERRLMLHLQSQPYTDPFAEWPHYVALFEGPVGGRTAPASQRLPHAGTGREVVAGDA